MADFMQDPNSALGQIQKLMGQVAQNYDPQERNQALERQQVAQQNYNQVLQQPLPDQGPISRMVSDYLTKYAAAPNMAWSAAASAIGTEGARSQQMDVSQLMRQQEAAKEEARMAGDAVKEADLFSGKFMASFGRGAVGRAPSPEQLRTVYTGLRNEAAQVAKGYKFDSAAHREGFIEQYANRGMDNYLRNFATQPLGPRGELSAEPEAVQTGGWSNPGTLQPSDEAGQAARNIQAIQAELKRPEVMNDPDRTMVLKQELQRAQSVLPREQQTAKQPGSEAMISANVAAEQAAVKPTQPSTTTMPSVSHQPPVSLPPARNIPAEEGAKQGAKDMAGAYVEDYKAVQGQAAAAEQQKTAFDTLAKIQPDTNALANVQQHAGALLQALGQDPNSQAVQTAIKTRNANLIISQLTNASLKAEKGVQTKTDEVRIANEFPKTSDFRQVWNFSVKLGQERAQRVLDERDFFEAVAAANNGTPVAARQLWNKQMSGDPLTQYLGGKLIFRSDFIRAYTAKHPELGANGAVQVWREMEREYQQRGGRK